MKWTWGANSIPELNSYSSSERTQIWRRYHRKSLLSLHGVLILVLWVVIVAAGMFTAEYFDVNKNYGMIIGNVAASFTCLGFLNTEIRRRLLQDLVNAESKRTSERTL